MDTSLVSADSLGVDAATAIDHAPRAQRTASCDHDDEALGAWQQHDCAMLPVAAVATAAVATDLFLSSQLCPVFSDSDDDEGDEPPLRLRIRTTNGSGDGIGRGDDHLAANLAASPAIVPLGSCFATPQAFTIATAPQQHQPIESSTASPTAAAMATMCKDPPSACEPLGRRCLCNPAGSAAEQLTQSPSPMYRDAASCSNNGAWPWSSSSSSSWQRRPPLGHVASLLSSLPGGSSSRGASGSVEISLVAAPSEPPTATSAPHPAPPIAVAVKTIDLRDDFRRESALAELAFAERVADVLVDRDAHGGPADEHQDHKLWRGIAQIHGAGVDADGGRCTVVCEALCGGTLESASRTLGGAGAPMMPVVAAGGGCAGSPPPVQQLGAALRIVARDVLLGLSTLHSTFRAVHNDLKLDNVMLVRPLSGVGDICTAGCGCLEGLRAPAAPQPASPGPPCSHEEHAKLIDFGCAVLLPLHRRDGGDENATHELPQRGALSTMAPERLRGDPYGPKADVWALGAMLLQLARGGRHPFLSPPPAVVAMNRAAGDPATDKFWRLAAVLHAVDGGEACETATRCAVTAALNDSALGCADAGFRAFVRRALQADASRRASVTELLSSPWLLGPPVAAADDDDDDGDDEQT